MFLGLTSGWLLLGLAGLALPVLIHLLTRRRHEVLRWGAMQFLRQPTRQRARRSFDELWLLLVRLLLLALIVFALAGPFLGGVDGFRPRRDVVLILDASASMDLAIPGQPRPWDEAKRAALAKLEELSDEDRVGVVLATHPPQRLTPHLTKNRAEVRQALESLPSPRGSADGAGAIAEACRLLDEDPRRAERSLWLASDFQHWGWGDDDALRRWHALAGELKKDSGHARTALETLALTAAQESLGPVNVGLSPLRPQRSVAGVGQKIAFTADVILERHQGTPTPTTLEVSIDGKASTKVDLPTLKTASTPIRFELTFTEPGLRRVRAAFTAPSKYWDAFAADNSQERIVEVATELPILLIDGGGQGQGSSYYLSKAFTEPGDPKKVSLVTPRIVRVTEFEPARDLEFGPRVVVLCDVPSLADSQRQALEAYVRAGGSLWIYLGPRSEANPSALLLPGTLSAVKGDAFLDGDRFLHAGLEVFKKSALNGLAIRKRWRLEPEAGSIPWALFNTGEPWLIEKRLGKGRILASTIPFDRSWDNPLTTAWEFPVLAHEIVYALADLRSDDFNVKPGTPVRLDPDRIPGWNRSQKGQASGSWQPWVGTVRTFTVASWPYSAPPPGPAGVYEIHVEDSAPIPVAVLADAAEADFVYLTPREWKTLVALLPFSAETGSASSDALPLWWVVLMLVVALLGVESWLAGRIVRRRGVR